MKIVLTVTGSSKRTLTAEQQFYAYEEMQRCLKGATNAFQKEILMLTGFADGIDHYTGMVCEELGIPWVICLPKITTKETKETSRLKESAAAIIRVGSTNDERDRYMIDKADSIIVCVKRGGKKNRFTQIATELSKQIVFLRIP